MDIHLVEREIHLDLVVQLQMEFAVRVRDPDVAGVDGEIELAGAGEYGGAKRIIRSSSASREGSNILAKPIVFDIDGSQRQKNTSHAEQNENRGDQAPER